MTPAKRLWEARQEWQILAREEMTGCRGGGDHEDPLLDLLLGPPCLPFPYPPSTLPTFPAQPVYPC